MNISILQMVLALVGFVVAVMAVFGYAGIKTAAIEAAEKEARKASDEQMRKFAQQYVISSRGQTESFGDFTSSDVPLTGAVPATEAE